MNPIIAAKELLAIAKELQAIEFPTQDAYDKYMKEHPDADKSLHRVVETKKGLTKKVDDFHYSLSQGMNKTKSLIDKIYRKALSSNNSKAVDAIEKAQKPFFKFVRDSGWLWTEYSDPWKDVSERDKKKLMDMAEKTLKTMKEIVKAHNLA